MQKQNLCANLHGGLNNKELMKKHLQTLSWHVRRSQCNVDRAFQNVDLLLAHDRWKDLKTSLRQMKEALDHLSQNVLPSDEGSQRVAFPSQNHDKVGKLLDVSELLYKLAIELRIDSSQLCEPRWTRTNSSGANPQQMTTMESNLKGGVNHIRKLFVELKPAADTDGKKIIDRFPHERLTGQV